MFALCPTNLMQVESVPEKNVCEGVLENLTPKLTLRFVETSAAICRTKQHNIREDLGLQKIVGLLLLLLLLLLLYTSV
jgi:hypothetical protein